MLSDDLHFVPLSLSPMIKKTSGDAVMLRLIHCPLNQFIDVEFYAQRNSQDTASHPNEAKYKFCHVWSGRPGENGQWHRTSQFLQCFSSLSLSTILKECKFRRDAFLFLQKNHTKMTAVRSVVFFFTIISHVCAIKQLEMRSNLIVPVLQFINIIPWPSIPVLPMEDWISGWLWDYLNHCITVFCSVFFYLKWPHLLLFDGVNITRTLKPKKKMVRTG